MKKAPKRYANGGLVDPTDPKKKKFVSTVPSVAQQMAAKGNINQTTADLIDTENRQVRTQDDNMKRFTPQVTGAGTPVNSGRTFLASDAQGNVTYKDNATGETYTLDPTGKRYAKGGTVKKMTKAPCRMKKGGTC